MEKQTDSTKSEGSKTVVAKKWYWYLGLTVLIFLSGIPVAVFKSVSYLVSGLPRHAAVELAYVPLNWAEWFLVTIPTRIEESPITGVSMLIGCIAVLGVGIWLMIKGRKVIDKSK